MNYLKKYNKKIIFLLGFFSALPFFFIPYKPFIYINKYYTESVWEGVPLFHPGYTSSIGLASPFLLLFLTIFVCLNLFLSYCFFLFKLFGLSNKDFKFLNCLKEQKYLDFNLKINLLLVQFDH